MKSLVIAICLLMLFLACDTEPESLQISFPELSGPQSLSIIPESVPIDVAGYAEGNISRLAILLTDPDSSWPGLVHAFKSFGIPFLITEDYEKAMQHQVVLVYPHISGNVLSREALQALGQFPRDGGTLIAINVLGGGLNPVFGFNEVVLSKEHYRIDINPVAQITDFFENPIEKQIVIGQEGSSSNRGYYSYSNPKMEPVAVYEDGTAAIIQNFYSQGQAYAIGFDIGFYFQLAFNNRAEDINRSYVNQYEPSIDSILRIIAAIYRQYEKAAVIINRVPENRALSVIFSHDVDYTDSLPNAVKYAEMEQSYGVKATYFIQAKYLTDYFDKAYFTAPNMHYLAELEKLGVEIASHTVCHSMIYAQMPVGSGEEHFPDYQPMIIDLKTTENATVLGELRVSKFLLEHFSENSTVVSFRPGGLSNPFTLPQAMQAPGYLYSSTVTANSALTHLPFRLNYNREYAAETAIYEFPITLEDEKAPKMTERFVEAMQLAQSISQYGGLFMILIHPNILDHKYEFEEKFIKAIKDIAWIGALEDFGEWWIIRDQVTVDAEIENGGLTILINSQVKIKGLGLQIPAGYTFDSVLPAEIAVTQTGDMILIDEFQRKLKISFNGDA